MAGHSIWGRLIIQKPHIQHNGKLDDLRAGFEIAKGIGLGRAQKLIFSSLSGKVVYSDSACITPSITNVPVDTILCLSNLLILLKGDLS